MVSESVCKGDHAMFISLCLADLICYIFIYNMIPMFIYHVLSMYNIYIIHHIIYENNILYIIYIHKILKYPSIHRWIHWLHILATMSDVVGNMSCMFQLAIG